MFETNSREKFFRSFFLILTKFSCWEEDWTLGSNSMKFADIF